MRLIVTTDSHGRKGKIFDIVERHIDNMDLFLNLGDCNNGRDLEDAEQFFGSRLKIKAVCGNCDWGSDLPAVERFSADNAQVLMCHGHTLYVKHGLEMLEQAAKKSGANLVLFGHTHTPYYRYENGLHIFNPGAVQDGRYGIVDVTPSGIICINADI